MSKPADDASPTSAQDGPSASHSASEPAKGKSSNWEFTERRRAQFERMMAEKRVKAADKKARAVGVRTLEPSERAGAPTRPGGPTTSDTPHEPPAKRRAKPTSDTAPTPSEPTEREKPRTERTTPQTRPTSDAQRTGHTLGDVLRLAIGLDPKGNA